MNRTGRGRRPPTPFLDAWRAQLARGERTALTSDATWRAACCEAEAVELDSILPARAAELRRYAAALMLADSHRVPVGAA